MRVFRWLGVNECRLGHCSQREPWETSDGSSMKVLLLGHWVPGASGKIPLLSKQSLDSLY